MSGADARTAPAVDPAATPERALERGLRVTLAVVAATPLAVVTSLLAASLVRSFTGGPRLSDYRAGSLVWFGIPKAGEAVQLVMLIGLLIGAALLAHRPPSSRAASTEKFRPVTHRLGVLALLAAPAVVPLLVGGTSGPSELVSDPLALALVVQAVPALHLVIRWLTARRTVRAPLDPVDAPAGPAYLFLLAASSLPVLGGLVVLRHVMAPRAVPVALILGLLVVFLVATAVASSRPRMLALLADDRALGWMFGLVAVGALPLLLPPLMVRGEVTITARGVSYAGWVAVLVVLMALALAETWYRSRGGPGLALASLGSLPVALVLAPLRAQHGWPVVPADDYHFGEVFSPFLAWSARGGVPYVDVPLVRGIVPNMLTSALNQLVGDGTAAIHAYGAPLTMVVTITLAHLLLRGAVGVPMATAMVALLGVANDYAEADLVVFAATVNVLARLHAPGRGAGVAARVVATAVLATLAYPLMGMATGLVLLGVAVVAGAGGTLSGRPSEASDSRRFLIGLVVLTGLVAASPLRAPLRAAVGYIIEGALMNSVANGIALDLTFVTITFGRIAQFAFVAAGLLPLLLIARHRSDVRRPSWDRWLRLATAAVPVALVVGLFGRFAGRVDPFDWSYRPAAGSVVLIGVVLPAALLLVAGDRGRRHAWASVAAAAVIASVVHPAGGVLRSTMGLVEAPTLWTSSPHAATVPRIGHGQGDPGHLAALGALGRAVETLGQPAVVNLTNRNALDGYFRWSSPLRPAAPYNIGSGSAETAAIAALGAARSDVALVGPGMWHDGFSLSLRTPHLARHLMTSTVPFVCEGWTWASRAGEGWAPSSTPGGSEGCEPTDERTAIALWSAAIGAPELLWMAPASWGSWGPLRVAADAPVLGPWSAEDDRSRTSTRIDASSSTGGADILLLEVSCPSRPAMAPPSHRAALAGRADLATVSWEAPEGVAAASFLWGAGRFAVPLDAYPSWFLRDPGIDALFLSVPDTCPDGWAVSAELAPRPMP